MIKTLGGRAAAMRAAVVPEWLAEVVRPRPAPVPWPEMIRAALAICVPLSVSLALGKGPLGVLPAMGGLLGTMADTGGPYLSRVKRVCSAAVFGGAAGLAIGSAVHGHGWLAVIALVVVAGVSGVLSAVGDDRLGDRAAAAGVHAAGHGRRSGRCGRSGTRPEFTGRGRAGR